MIKRISVTFIEDITIEIAAEHNNLPSVPGDRVLKKALQEGLLESVSKNMFGVITWSTIYCKETGKCHRNDGKHSSDFISDSQHNNRDTLKFVGTITHWECDTLEEMAALNMEENQRYNCRSTGDNNSVCASTMCNFADAMTTTKNKAATGIAFACNGKNYKSKSDPKSRSGAFFKYPDYCTLLMTLFEMPNLEYPLMFRRTSVAAAIFTSYLDDKRLAKLFWEAVFSDTGEGGTPERSLHKYLITTKNQAVRGATTLPDQQEKINKKCLTVWGKWQRAYKKNLIHS